MIKKVVFLAVALIISNLSAIAGEKNRTQKEEVDYIAVASVLIKDTYYDRAIKILEKVNLKKKKVDFKKYYTLKGYAYYKLGNLKEATENFEKAVKNGNRETTVYLYLIDSYYKLKNCEKTIYWIDKAGDITREKPDFFVVKATCYRRLKDTDNMLRTLNEGIKLFPDYSKFYKMKFYTFLELKLYQTAINTAKQLLNLEDVTPEDYVAVAKAFLSAKEYDNAVLFLEKANLLFPENEKILIALANAYYKKGNILAAAQIFEETAFINPKYYKDAAELYRKAGKLYHALYLNSKISDLKEKLKQRIAIFIDMKRFEDVVYMEDLLRTTGLMENDSIKYAFAYSAFTIGNYKKAEEYLKKINSSKLFRKATEILAMIQKCKQDLNLCF